MKNKLFYKGEELTENPPYFLSAVIGRTSHKTK